MSITVTPYLRPSHVNPDNENETAVYLRVQMDGKKYLKSVSNYYASDDQWDADQERMKVKASKNVKLHEQCGQINTEIEMLRTGMLDRYHKHTINFPGVKADPDVIIKNRPTLGINGQALRTDADVFLYMDEKIEELKGDGMKVRSLDTYTTILNRLELYLGKRKLNFSDINLLWLNEYKKSLRKLKYRPNTIYQNLTKLRYFCEMFAHDNLLVNFNPFIGFDIPEGGEEEKKDRLSVEELDKFEEYAETNGEQFIMVRQGRRRKDGTFFMRAESQESKKAAAIYFLLGCYVGLRHSDWGRFDLNKHIVKENGKRYVSGLVALKNGEEVNVPVHSRLARLLELIKKYPVAPKYDMARKHLIALTSELKIDKKISTHVGRKTFAVTICAERGISCETCATLMAIDIQTCLRSYYAVTLKKISNETEKGWADL